MNRWLRLALTVPVAAACGGSLSPLANRLAVGREPYVVFVAAGEGAAGDLYASSAAGGPLFPITYTRVDESAPALSPDGILLAFVRTRSTSDTAGRSVWVMNLLNGAERELPGPVPGTRPSRVAWSGDGKTLYVRADRGDYRVNAPPEQPDPRPLGGGSLGADSALNVWVGEPAFARITNCAGKTALCSVDTAGDSGVIVVEGSGPVRWGSDSLGYFLGDGFYVRPLGAGAQRRIAWAGQPVRPRELSYFGPGRR